ncbi:hypothetical protein BsIDN1_71690 [Bacillus safensis]|uniref:Uncharacterized protein n=1 Tax=Bacillus safensis TaxID=561879 RepID=A0A5S9MKR0_BACIA|nr:hypothetical protein BsIDN1_71690 [Bacillus safensis]
MYKENQVTIEKEIAGLLLSAIISDSLLFKSPTCTQQDIDAAHELAKKSRGRSRSLRSRYAQSRR